METKVFFFYVALAILILRFTPFDAVVISFNFGLVNTVAGLYVIIFSLHMLVKNLAKIKGRLSEINLIFANRFILKNEGHAGRDVIRFILVSILIAFCIDVVLTKLSDRPLLDYAKYIPVIQPALEIIDLNQTATQLSSGINRFINPAPPDTTGNNTGLTSGPASTDRGLTTESIRPFVNIALGAFILFVLRQFVYRNRYVELSVTPKNPGSRLLLLFITGSIILFVLDITQDMLSGFRSVWEIPSSPNDTKNATLYQLINLQFFSYRFTNPFVFLTIVSIWAFDWFLFSKVWVHYGSES
jgi:hypothetical protein